APLHPVGAVVGAPCLGDVERLVPALAVVVPQHVVGADHHAGGAPGAEAGRHHLCVQMGPVEFLGRHVATLSTLVGPVPGSTEAGHRAAIGAAIGRPPALPSTPCRRCWRSSSTASWPTGPRGGRSPRWPSPTPGCSGETSVSPASVGPSSAVPSPLLVGGASSSCSTPATAAPPSGCGSA